MKERQVHGPEKRERRAIASPTEQAEDPGLVIPLVRVPVSSLDWGAGERTGQVGNEDSSAGQAGRVSSQPCVPFRMGGTGPSPLLVLLLGHRAAVQVSLGIPVKSAPSTSHVSPLPVRGEVSVLTTAVVCSSDRKL